MSREPQPGGTHDPTDRLDISSWSRRFAKTKSFPENFGSGTDQYLPYCQAAARDRRKGADTWFFVNRAHESAADASA